MLNFPLAPGVHIDDITRSSLTVTTATPGLPVMVIGTDGPWSALYQPYLVGSFAEIERWLQGESGVRSNSVSAAGFASARPVRKGGNPAHQRLSSLISGPENQSSSEPDWTHPSFSALKAYFDNGGGACYLCRSDQLNQIADLSDATLVVQAGQPLEVGLAISALCQPGSGLFALLDGPNDAPPADDNAETVKLQPNFDAEALAAFVSEYNANASAALYYPWLSPQWLLYQRSGEPVGRIHPVAPSAVAAALIQQTDRQIGPWKAPANLTLQPGLQPLVKVGDASQARFNQDGKLAVNMLREFPGIGVQLWGARTLSAGDVAWSYVPVRRTFDRIERDMQQSLRKVLFKPNGPQTWQQLRNAAENYLFNLFEAGAFAGTTPEQSYQVQVGVGSSMTEQDLNDGILRMNIGLAVVRPAEFIVLEFSQTMASAVSGDVITPIREPLRFYSLSPFQLPDFPPSPSGHPQPVGMGRCLSMGGTRLLLRSTNYFQAEEEQTNLIIYQRGAAGWKQEFFEVMPYVNIPGATLDNVMLSPDGNYAFYNTFSFDDDELISGVFWAKNNNGVWPALSEWNKLTLPEDTGMDVFGITMSSYTGYDSWLAISVANVFKEGYVVESKVLMYKLEGDEWLYHQVLDSSGEVLNPRLYGGAIKFDSTGSVLAISAPNSPFNPDVMVRKLSPANEGGTGIEIHLGAVDIYHRVNELWVYHTTLTPEDDNEAAFGTDLAFNQRGDLVVSSAAMKFNTELNVSEFSGRLYLFTNKEGVWQQEHRVEEQSQSKKFTGYQLCFAGENELVASSIAASRAEPIGDGEIEISLSYGVTVFFCKDGTLSRQYDLTDGATGGNKFRFGFGFGFGLSSSGNYFSVFGDAETNEEGGVKRNKVRVYEKR
ncbi:phage tail sheath family protein [Pantoea sp. A4]|uniref:phage tail sheath family protein n=1 Tax=Pantoea sp. A4 TaxID=1225184 RepID=UPI00036D4872|nr:phage tail sheath C-terminal domain-containing protein [Pantoea sp. A4]